MSRGHCRRARSRTLCLTECGINIPPPPPPPLIRVTCIGDRLKRHPLPEAA